MELVDYGTIAGIASIFISGAAVILTWIARAFWSLTYKKKVEDDEKRFIKIEANIQKLNEAEESNKYFRHNFDAVTKNLFEHITSQINHLKELIELKFKLLEKRNNEKD